MLQETGKIDTVVDFTDPTVRKIATEDPFGFVDLLQPPLGIDEVQLVPDLVLAIKRMIDADHNWGPVVLTGSSPVARGQLGGSDPLVGRSVRMRMRPLTQRELNGRDDQIIDLLTDPEFVGFDKGQPDRSAYLEIACRSGFPAAADLDARQAATWFRASYVDGALPRALDDENRRISPRILTQVFRSLAALPATELNASSFAQALEVSRHTVTSHVSLLGDLGLLDTVSGWRVGGAKRHVSRPKVHPCDGAMSSWALGDAALNPLDIQVGGLIESLVYRELAAQVDASFGEYELFHWRHQRNEVDLLLAGNGYLVPLEIKASRSVSSKASQGILALAAQFPDLFRRGIVLYTGDAVIPLGPKLLAVPISALWTTAANQPH